MASSTILDGDSRRKCGKRPDGITMVPWECGKLLVGMLPAPIPLLPHTSQVPPVRQMQWLPWQREQEEGKVCQLGPTLFFQPVAVETSGTFGPDTFAFVKELSCKVNWATGESMSFPFLVQHLAVAIQRANRACRV